MLSALYQNNKAFGVAEQVILIVTTSKHKANKYVFSRAAAL